MTGAPLEAQSVGTPLALSALARMLWALHTRPALQLVPPTAQPDEQPRDPVPALEQGQV